MDILIPIVTGALIVACGLCYIGDSIRKGLVEAAEINAKGAAETNKSIESAE